MFVLPNALAQARAAARRRDYAAAQEHYREVLRRKPKDVKAWIQYGHALKELGRIEEAEEAYRTAIRLSPHESEAYRYLGHMLKGRDANAARHAFLLGSVADPEASDLRGELQGTGKLDPLEQLLAILEIGRATPAERGRFQNPLSWVQVPLHRALARKAARARRWQEAAAHYRKLVILWPFDASANLQLGHSLKERGDLAGALASYRRAVLWDPYDPEAHRHLGYALRLSGDRAAAELAFATSLRLNPAIAHVREELIALGWTQEAVAEIARRSWAVTSGKRAGEPDPWNLAGREWGRFERPANLNREERALWADLADAVARA